MSYENTVKIGDVVKSLDFVGVSDCYYVGVVVGISKIARLVEAFASRLQIQEKLTAQIANAIDRVLKPVGVGVVIKASHHCMVTRGVQKAGTDLVTSRLLGSLRDDPVRRSEFFALVDRRHVG